MTAGETSERTASPREAAVGSSARKRGGRQLLTGRARYVDDFAPRGMLHAVVIRSSMAHARLLSVETSAAEAAPGVRLVLTGAQAAALSGPIPHFIDPGARGGPTKDLRCLATEKVVYVGEPVAAVVASSRHECEAAARLVRVSYEGLPVVLDAEESLSPDAPRIYPEWPDNVVLHKHYGVGDVDAALASADVVLSGTVRVGRQSSAPIEPRGLLASWESADETLTVRASCQNPHQMRWMLSRSLDIDERQIRIIGAQVGGSFGLKMQGHPEETLICLLSKLTDAPVKWIEDRRETFLAGAREQVHHFTVGAMADGRIVGLRDRIVANCGALSAQPGWAMPNMSAATLPTGYRLQDCRLELHVVVTNKPPLNATRGFGKPEANLVMERIVDQVARAVGVDAAEVRRQNLLGPSEFPYRTATGLNIDSGNYPGLLDKTLAAIDYDGFRARQARARDQGRYLGIGLAFELTPESADGPGTLVAGYDVTTIRMGMSGQVTVLTGVTSPGGGNDTGIAQVVSDELGVPMDWIRVIQGDTAQCPAGYGNFSGRSMLVGGGSAALAARDLRAKLLTVGSRLLEASPDDVEVLDGVIRVRDDPGRSLSVQVAAQTVLSRAFTIASDVDPTLEATRAYKPGNIDHVPDEFGRVQPYPTYSSCMHAAVVEVDVETGLVTPTEYVMTHDCGTVINPALVEGQALGALSMGLGEALMTELLHDDDGRLITDRFKTFLLPRAADMPPIRLLHQVTPSPFTLFGNKGAGEAGVGGALGAVANAVEDALSTFGVTVEQLPLTPPRVLALLDGVRDQ